MRREAIQAIKDNMAEKNEIIAGLSDLLREWRDLTEKLYEGTPCTTAEREFWEAQYQDLQKRTRQALGEEPPGE